MSKQSEDIGKWVTGEKNDNNTENRKSAWSMAMQSGWFDQLPAGNCSDPSVQTRSMPIAGKIGGWCDKAGMISEAGAYGMWIWLAFTVFGMLTGGAGKGD